MPAGQVGGTGVNCDAANGRHIWQLFKCDNNNVPSPLERDTAKDNKGSERDGMGRSKSN